MKDPGARLANSTSAETAQGVRVYLAKGIMAAVLLLSAGR